LFEDGEAPAAGVAGPKLDSHRFARIRPLQAVSGGGDEVSVIEADHGRSLPDQADDDAVEADRGGRGEVQDAQMRVLRRSSD
jgi:hypothetical protein